ncbi:MAG: LysR family transcriptional regulator [Dinoroseobacter sp.]|nr:LysR family transcriptional regulator [Dinoroseobacter sp.]
MDLLDGLKAFVATAQTKSFTAAAEQMGISNRLTSKYVAELEAELGVRLLQRTTRKVGLTPAGAELLARAPALLDDLDDLVAEVSEGSRGFTGMIRVTAPMTFGELYVAPMVGRFSALHPALTVSLQLTDQYADLATEGIDVAFRVGAAEVLSVKALKLGNLEVIAAAAPSYLSRHGMPNTPADLDGHACILDTNRKSPKLWRFSKDGTETNVLVSGRYFVNSASAACALAKAGNGVAYGPRFALEQAIDAKKLIQVLPDYTGEIRPVSAVYLEGRVLPRKVRALIDFARDDFRQCYA